MSIERTAHPYIIRDSTIYGGEPIITGTRTGVRHVILLFEGGQDPEEIAANQRLTLAQVYDAISYSMITKKRSNTTSIMSPGVAKRCLAETIIYPNISNVRTIYSPDFSLQISLDRALFILYIS